ncbi:MAG: hypothetical protein JXR37_07205 [Kiritimatiellae bacterium]|nr:hypothetical protein [Kiritimatiellia bacterium]
MSAMNEEPANNRRHAVRNRPALCRLVLVYLALVSPVRASSLAIQHGDSRITLAVSDMAAGTTNSVERCANLAEAAWEPVASFLSTGTHTNWSEATGDTRAFYRVATHLSGTFVSGNRLAWADAECSPWEGIFPSDIYTVSDTNMVTGRRVNLPLPPEDLVSERLDALAVSTLDGFSLCPRITIPFQGSVPDTATFTTGSVFLVALSLPDRGAVIPIDQRIIDSALPNKPRLICAPSAYLRESSRYATVVTRDLSAGAVPVRPAPEFVNAMSAHATNGTPGTVYEASVFDALDVISDASILPLDRILTLSVFTTRTVSDLAVKLRNRLIAGDFTITAPDLNVDGFPGNEVFDASAITAIRTFLHRASLVSDGSAVVNFGPGSLVSDVVGTPDWTQEVYAENVRTGHGIPVPVGAMAGDGSVTNLDVTLLNPAPGDEIILLVKKQILGETSRPYLWNSTIGQIVFGAVDTPSYQDATGRIPSVKTGAAFVPQQTGTNRVVFALFVPAAATPAGGWPLAHYAHGGGGSFLDGGMLHSAPVMAIRGMATLAFSAPGHGGGPRTTIELTTANGTAVIPGSGRARDYDGNGRFEDQTMYRHRIIQRISDFYALVRSVQLGVDIEGDSAAEITTDPARTSLFGISFGGRTTTLMAATEPNISVFAANVPGIGGSPVNFGYHPVLGSWRSTYDAWCAARIPALLNGASPEWGGLFNEDIPTRGQPVQDGMAAGAEALQRALDFKLWQEQEQATASYARHVASGALRGAPAAYFVQIVRGDSMAVNPMQWLLIESGGLKPRSGIIRCDNEPAFDAKYLPYIPGGVTRHLLLALPFNGFPSTDVSGYISHLARVQIGDFILANGVMISDPDGSGEIFSGDVFQAPIPDAVYELMSRDGGF